MSSDTKSTTPGLDPVWTLALARTVGEAFDLERSEEEVVRRLVEQLAAQLPGRVVVLLTGQPGSVRLSAAEVSSDWAGAGGPDRLSFTPEEAASAAVEATAFEAVSAPAPLGHNCVTSSRAPLTGGGVTGLLALERETVAAATETEEDGVLASLLAAMISTALIAHRRHGEWQQRQQLASASLRQADALLLVMNAENRVRFFSRSLEQLTGFTEQEMHNVVLGDWLGHGESGGLAKVFADALSGRATRGHEARLPLKTGGRVLVVMGATPVVDERHTVLGVVGVGLARRQLAELSDQFESRATRRSQMIAAIGRKLDDAVKALRGEAERDAVTDSLARLASGLDLLSRSTAEDIAPTSLNVVIEAALGDCSEALSSSRARVRTAFAGELPDLLGVASQLQLALRHLVLNACQALPEEGGRLTVRTWDNRDGTVGLSIADDGRGIREAALPQIFKPFYSEGAGERLGLGLAVVQDVVDQHDGSIDVDSDEGEGTVVTVTLPVRSAHDPEDDSQ